MSKKAELVTGYFPNIYLSVTSLLQGIALSQLVPIILIYLRVVPNPWSDIHLLPLVIMMLIIFIVWHHYAISIFFLRWFPNIIDTLVPFLIGIGQFVLLSYINIETKVEDIQMEPWTLGFAGFLIAGSFAYFLAAWRMEADLFDNVMSKESTLIHTQLTRRYYNIAGISILGQGVFALLIGLMHWSILLWVSLILLVSHLVIFEYFLLTSIKPHYVRAMDEYEANRESND